MEALIKLLDMGYSFTVQEGKIVPHLNGGKRPTKELTESLFEELRRNKQLVLKFIEFDKDYFFNEIVNLMNRLNDLQFDRNFSFAAVYCKNYQLYNKITKLQNEIDRLYQIHDGVILYKTLGQFEQAINEIYHKYGKLPLKEEYKQNSLFDKAG